MEFIPPDPNVRRIPPLDTRLIDVQAEPYPDGKRLRVMLSLTPFEQKPCMEINVTGPDGTIAASASIVEPATFSMDLTLHIRRAQNAASGPYTLVASLYYPELGEVDHRRLLINLPAPTP